MAELRVIAGEYRGMKLTSPHSAATHPMGAREKNALFNMLQPWILDARVLDVYAGTGALGIEALSRGADSVVFVEQQASVARVLHENLMRIRVEADIFTESAQAFAMRPEWQKKFDLIIADPPYDRFRTEEIAKLSGLLVNSGILALSYPGELGELELNGFKRLVTRHYAAAGIGVYQKVL